MDSLNDLIWNPENDDVLDPNGIGEDCMIEICLVAFCDPPPVGDQAQNCGVLVLYNPDYCN